MSRSIHVTHHQLEEARKFRFTNREEHSNKIKKMSGQLGKKRLIKRLLKAESPHLATFAPPVDSTTIPIRLKETGPYIHYPASIEDVQQVLKRLPPSVLNGLTSIEFCLEAHEAPFDSENDEIDPFINRPGQLILPGIYNGLYLGTYTPNTATIRLFAYVYDPAIANREMWELYLRLHMLSSLLHEIAHHFDHLSRVARGRWLAWETEKTEIYARKIEYDWLQTYVIPYIEEAYPVQLQVLNNWIAQYCTISLALLLLAGDPRTRSKGGGITTPGLFGSSATAFETFVLGLNNNEDLTEIRLRFARDLHYNEVYAEALQILTNILVEKPSYLKAMALQGDIYVHQGKYVEAQVVANQILKLDAIYVDAWEVLCDAYEHLADWTNLEISTTQALTSGFSSGEQVNFLVQRSRANMKLGNLSNAQADITTLTQIESTFVRRWVIKLQKELEVYNTSNLNC
jgi:tetratricopeptide (TPR) repeat protein